MENETFAQKLDSLLKERGVTKRWLSNTLPMLYDTLMYKFRHDKFTEIEKKYIRIVLKVEE